MSKEKHDEDSLSRIGPAMNLGADDHAPTIGEPSPWSENAPPGPLPDSFDARDWARSFVSHAQWKPTIPTDEATMVAWFASAIMAGWDAHARRYPTDALIHQVGLFDSTPTVSQPHFDACNAIFVEALKFARPHVDHDAPEYREVNKR